MRKLIVVVICALLAACGDGGGALVFPNGQAAWPGLSELRFGESCDSVADKMREQKLLYIMSDGTDPTKDRNNGGGMSLKSQDYMGIKASAGVDCDDNDKLEGFRVIGDEDLRDESKYQELLPYLIRNWAQPSREETKMARDNHGNRADLPNAYWDSVGGTAIHARLAWHPIRPSVHIYVSFTPAAKQ